jgi:segregation and condensation protein A
MYLRLENFDGPLDLLLHLIKQQEINIFNIPISLVAEQYVTYLRNVPMLDFHSAGEFLAMAAQLLEIKANLLVPALQNKLVDAQSLQDIPEDDPRRQLVESLLEFEAIREACEKLDKLSILGRDVFPSGEATRREEEYDNLLTPIKGDSFSLVIAFERMLLRFAQSQSAPTVKVRAQKVTIQSRMVVIKRRLGITQHVTLRELFDDCETRYDLIVTIMATLELAKAHHVLLRQDELFSPIVITIGDKFYEQAPELGDEGSDAVQKPKNAESEPIPSPV